VISSSARYLAAFALAASTAGAQTVVVTSPGVKSVTGAAQSDAFATDVWLRDNVRDGSSIGISSTYARSGNGSMYMSGTIANTSKADAEYFFGGAVLSPFTLGSLQGASYDVFRASSITAIGHLHPSLRFLVDADGDMSTVGDRGYLIYEGIYNGLGAMPVDAWTTMTIGATTNLWFRQFSPGVTVEVYDRTLADYQAGYTSPNGSTFGAGSLVYGLSSGIGSGWDGSYTGAVDNISVTQNGRTTTFNFELAPTSTVPEPATAALLGGGLLGVMGIGAARRRRAR
jgi:hypothetical protein